MANPVRVRRARRIGHNIMGVEIYRGQQQEVIRQLISDSVQKHFTGFMTEQQRLQQISDMSAADNLESFRRQGVLLLGKKGSQLCAVAGVKIVDGEAWLGCCYCKTSGQGWGSRMMRARLEWLKSYRRCNQVLTEAFQGNTMAHQHLARHGFSEQDTLRVSPLPAPELTLQQWHKKLYY